MKKITQKLKEKRRRQEKYPTEELWSILCV